MTITAHRDVTVRHLRKWMLTGLVVAAPVVITIYLIWLAVHTTDVLVVDLMPNSWRYVRQVPGIGLVVTLTILTIIGIIVSNYAGQIFLQAWDKVLNRLPVVRAIYGPSKQVLEALFSEKGRSFKEVVYIEAFRPGQWSLGFVIADDIVMNGASMLRVFVPFVPIPTTGIMVVVARAATQISGITVEDGIKLVVTMGLVHKPVSLSATE